jgi:NADH-quinone oxidoreductase subunit E
MLRTEKKAKYVIKVCDSLPCKVNKSMALINKIRDILNIEPGQTTADGLFSMEIVSCLGLCDESPVIMINEEVYGKLTVKKLENILYSLKNNEN